MKKNIYLFLYIMILWSVTGCAAAESIIVDKPEEQNVTETSIAEELLPETWEKNNAETEIKKESAYAETGIIAEQKKQEQQEEMLTTVICKRENDPMPEYVFPETVDLAEFDELSYRLFISWEMIHIDGGLIYFDYGILDKENNTWKKAIERYSQEMEKVLGYPEEMIWENTDEASGRRVDREMMERITDISPNGEYYITYRDWFHSGATRKKEEEIISKNAEIKIYHGNQYLRSCPEEILGDYVINRQLCTPFGFWLGGQTDYIYNLVDGTKEAFNNYGCPYKNYGYLNKDATLMATTDCDHTGIIYLYDMHSQQRLYSFEKLCLPENDTYINIHQLIGNKDKGFILFEDPSGVYKLHYPSGEIELVGHYMFNPSLSPDGKYLFYSGPDDNFWKCWGIESDSDQYGKIPAGVYIRELQTGKTAYIEMDENPWYQNIEVRWLETSDT